MNKSIKASLALATAGVLAFTGCGGSSKSSSSASSSTLPLAQLNVKARGDLKQGGNLRFAISQLPVNWNYLELDGTSADLNTILGFTNPQALSVDEKGTITFNKDYLTGWDIVKPEGSKPQTVTLHINPKAKWNNGRAIDWTDIEAMWKACNGTNSAYKSATSDGFNLIKSVAKGATDQDVVITYSKPSPDWQSPISTWFPKEQLSAPAVFNSGSLEAHPEWTAGPFTISKVDKAQRVVTLARNPKWWGDPALLDTVTFRELQAPADVQAFANNEIDIINPIINASAYKTVQKRTDGEIRQSQGTSWRQFTVNSKSGVLTDEKVRQAISKGINTEAITRSDLAGMPVDAAKQQLGNHFFMPGHKDYKDNNADVKYDFEGAKKLLDEDGWKLADGQKYRTKDGKELDVKFTVLSSVPTSENEGKLFQSDMEKLGIKVNLVNIAPTDMTKTLSSHSFDIMAFTWVGTIFPMNNIRQIYGADKEGSTTPSGNNYAQLVNPEIEKLIPTADTELDQDKRAETVNNIDKMIFDEVHTIPLYSRVNYTAVPKNLANYGSSLYQSTPAQDIGFAK